MPSMVRWFHPLLLLDTARQAIASGLFGQYADRRLIHAALDANGQLTGRGDLTQVVKCDDEGAIWVDFVADLGDGFDSTYAIAYLLSRPHLDFPGVRLPRGDVLIMGGDQVYPTATREEYDRRMKTPYEWAFPRPAAGSGSRPHLFLIPGNHDWYDGLVLFLAKFCRGRPTSLGSWIATQHRSYFSVKLPDNWWIWGIDIQLTEDIDGPQAEYFVSVARAMPSDAKIILCSAVPSWLKAESSGKDEFYRSLDYVACIARDECQGATICAVLSGDIHHYSRYSANDAGTQFITAGGGGAFLHPTHTLKDTIEARWVRQPETLSLKTDPELGHEPTEQAACYPSRDTSRGLLWRNLGFFANNWEFSLSLGLVYWICHQLLFLWRGDVLDGLSSMASPESFWIWPMNTLGAVANSPMFICVAAFLWIALFKYADGRKVLTRLALGTVHALFHLLLVLGLSAALPPVNIGWLGLSPTGLSYWAATLVEFLAFGFVGGLIWGLYLLLTCLIGARHSNDAFSAMRLDSYKNFLRMRIKGDELMVYPIGLDAPPRRDGWMANPRAEKGNQNEPIVMPRHPIEPRIIEGPIVIAAPLVKPVAAMGE